LKPLTIVTAAEAELREAVAWYHERDPRAAERFAREARQTLSLIEEFPKIGGRVAGVDDRHVRGMPIHSFPYHIVFVEFADRLEVIAFAHNRRRPAYFVNRIRSS